MMKDERWDAIVALVDQKGTIRVNEIMERLSVSDMTIRRDLTELEELGRVERVHGGAKSTKIFKQEELAHQAKKIINRTEKKMVAQKAVSLIKENETIFLGPGTTIELLAEIMSFESVRVVTNCLPVFELLNQKKGESKIYLLGGEMRAKTKSFYGEITNNTLLNMHFHKAFFSCNALKGKNIMTATIEEGQTQAIALNNAVETFLLMDSSKVDKEDFYTYYNLDNVTAVVMNEDTYETHLKIEKNVTVII